MFTVTRYHVQEFRQNGGRLELASVRWFREEAPALALARFARKRAAGVMVYSVEGEPVSDLWREPVMLAAYGSVPDLA